MRVLVIITARSVGGAERYVVQLAGALAGYARFSFVLPDHPNLRAFATELSALGSVHSWPLDHPRQWPTVIPALRRLSGQYDVVHLNSNHPGSRLGIAFSFALSGTATPLICVEHSVSPLNDIVISLALKPILPTLFRLSRRHAARVIAVSHDNAEKLTQLYGIPATQIEIIHNCVSLPTFEPSFITQARAELRAELDLAAEDVIALTLARLAANKGHRYLIAALPAVLQRFPRAHFVFAGAPDEQAALAQQAAALNVSDHVHILGFRTDTLRLLAGSDLFVLPSLGEGLPLSVIEALAAGLPVVATRVGGIPEVVVHGRHGLLVPPADTPALRDALLSVLGLDASTRAQWQQSARERAGLFRAEIMAERMLKVYRAAADAAYSKRF